MSSPITRPELLLAPLDSTRAVVEVYSISLVVTLPVILACLGAVVLRHAPAAARMLVWRSTVIGIVAIFGLQLLPSQWVAWVVPATLAEPLIALGRLSVAARDPVAAGGSPDGMVVLRALTTIYLAGVGLVLVPLVRGWHETRRVVRIARPVTDPRWLRALAEARRRSGVAADPMLLESDLVAVPFTARVFRPVIVVPSGLGVHRNADRLSVLLHELAHVAARDVAFMVAAHVACALLWFHPATWWIARCMRQDAELASDDRVIAAGVRPSEYGALLLAVSDGSDVTRHRALSASLAGQGTFHRRLVAIATPGRNVGAPGVAAQLAAAVMVLALAAAGGTLELEPTRAVLRDLMHDARWESRAVAVLGLAPRADSVSVTRQAAVTDPSPHVRAWASYALAQHADADRPPTPSHP